MYSPFPQTPSPLSFISYSIHSISMSYHRKRGEAQLCIHDKISIMVSLSYSVACSSLTYYLTANMSINKIMILSNFSTSEFLHQNVLWWAHILLLSLLGSHRHCHDSSYL